MDSCARLIKRLGISIWVALRSKLLKSFLFAGYFEILLFYGLPLAVIDTVFKAPIVCLTLNRFKSCLSTLSELENIRFTKRPASHALILLSLQLSVSELLDDAAPSRIMGRLILVTSWAYLPVSRLRIAIVCCLYFLMNLPKSISFSIWEAALSSFFR